MKFPRNHVMELGVTNPLANTSIALMLQLTNKQKFTYSEATILAWAASVQRARLYDSNVEPKDRQSAAFRAAVLQFIETKLVPKYVAQCSEQDHIANIQSLVEFGSQKGQGLLGKAGYKFGVAQKLLNLLLKYLWCLDHIAEPPHCPVDRLVLDKTSLRGKLNWTEITTVKAYQMAISAISDQAEKSGLSIAHWELQFYARR